MNCYNTASNIYFIYYISLMENYDETNRLDFFFCIVAVNSQMQRFVQKKKNLTKKNIYVSLMRLKYWKRTFLITKKKEAFYFMINIKKSFIQKLLPRTGYFIDILLMLFYQYFYFVIKQRKNCFLIEKMRYKKLYFFMFGVLLKICIYWRMDFLW